MKKERFYSLDVFRGATICLMILVNNPGSWAHIYPPFKHASWHGVTPTDLVYPFFLFAVGNAFAFVIPRLREKGDAEFWKKVVKRSFLIFIIGLFLNWFPFIMRQDGQLVFRGWEYYLSSGELGGIRILGVLQRIALAYFFASIIAYYFKRKSMLIISGLILFGYWLLTYLGNPADPYSLEGWFGTAIDKAILGEAHMYHGEWLNGKPIAFDPEGLMSLFNPIVQIIFGYLVGHYIITKGKTAEMVNTILIGGALLLFAGYVWDFFFPINKKIWTSSYTVYSTGMAMLVIGVMIYFLELKQKRGWYMEFFNVFGKNPLFIYVLSGAIVKAQALIRIPNGVNSEGDPAFASPFSWYYEHIGIPIFANNLKAASLFHAITFIVILWLIAYWMDRKRIYVKV